MLSQGRLTLLAENVVRGKGENKHIQTGSSVPGSSYSAAHFTPTMSAVFHPHRTAEKGPGVDAER